MDKLKILSEHLDCEIEEIKQGYDESTFELGNQEYVILTDEQADQRAKDYIKESVWAFSSWFLVKHTGLDEDIIMHLQDKCESANDVLLNAVKDIDTFIDDAISLDGRGHFMSSYDGQEYDVNGFYIYRTN